MTPGLCSTSVGNCLHEGSNRWRRPRPRTSYFERLTGRLRLTLDGLDYLGGRAAQRRAGLVAKRADVTDGFTANETAPFGPTTVPGHVPIGVVN